MPAKLWYPRFVALWLKVVGQDLQGSGHLGKGTLRLVVALGTGRRRKLVLHCLTTPSALELLLPGSKDQSRQFPCLERECVHSVWHSRSFVPLR